jgi:cell division protein FtsZ
VIFGTAYDENMGDSLRVTVVATGLGRKAVKPQLVRNPYTARATGTDSRVPMDADDLTTPSVWRSPRNTAANQVAALEESGMDRYDIPAFLRRQAD